MSARWVGSWTASPQLTEPGNLPPPPGLADTTLRQTIHLSLGGARLRVRFSNAFGTAPLTIYAAHVATPTLPTAGGGIRPETDRALTFAGQPSVTITPGALVVSDPVAFPLAPLSDLTVTLRVKDASLRITGHPGARCTTYLTTGDQVSSPRLTGAATTPHWYYLNGVEVETTEDSAAVVVLGDSLSDGRGSTVDGNARWPDVLARRLQDDAKTRHWAVLNAGIGGNRVCRDGLGPSALSRLDRDILAQPGVRSLIVIEGINDLGTNAATAGELIAAYRQIVLRAHDRGIRVYSGTITACGNSFYDTPKLRAARDTINQWTRTPGNFDAVIDFDAATRDARDPARVDVSVDSGDHLHLNDLGYQRMAAAVDLRLFSQGR